VVQKKSPTTTDPSACYPHLQKYLKNVFTINETIFFSSFQLLNKQQFGFRKNHYTFLAVSSICNAFVQYLDKGKIACSIFLDLAKAFDTVDHTILSSKLERYGVRGLPLQLIKSYLTNRYQRAVVDSLKSNEKLVTCGVPQGSTLGPFFIFSLYLFNCQNSMSACLLMTLT